MHKLSTPLPAPRPPRQQKKQVSQKSATSYTRIVALVVPRFRAISPIPAAAPPPRRPAHQRHLLSILDSLQRFRGTGGRMSR